MKSLRQLKKRIKSVKNTAKITSALEMVSISKMKLFQNLANSSLEYANDIAILATMIAGSISDDSTGISKRILNKYFTQRDSNLPVALVVFSPTRGFCGSLITEMISMLNKSLDKNTKYVGIGIQKKSKYIMSKFSNIEIETVFEKAIEKTDFSSIETVFDYVMGNYLLGKYSKVVMVYSHFGGSFNYTPTLKQILPLDFEDLKKYVDTDNEKELARETFQFEPRKSELVNSIVDRYVKTVFLYTLISAKASEHNARMIAMKNATDNASQLKESLNLQYNKSRQESITTELLDIVGGKVKNNI